MFCKKCKQKIPDWQELCFYCKRKQDKEKEVNEKILKWESKDLFDFINWFKWKYPNGHK